MQKIKHILKRSVSFVCGVLIMLNVGIMPLKTSADVVENSQQLARDMIGYYRAKNSTASELTKQDLVYFGVFMSNYYTPFETDISDSATYNETTYQVMSYLKDVDITEADNYANLVATKTQANLYKCSPLKDESGKTATLGELFFSEEAHEYYTDKDTENPVFRSVPYNGENDDTVIYTLLRFLLMYLFSNISNKEEIIEKMSDETAQLAVSPFGDIVYTEGTTSSKIIVPACLNPYVFTEDGSKLPINNSFFMGCMSLVNNNAEVNNKNLYMNDTEQGGQPSKFQTTKDKLEGQLKNQNMVLFNSKVYSSTMLEESSLTFNIYNTPDISSLSNYSALDNFIDTLTGNDTHKKGSEILQAWMGAGKSITVSIDKVYATLAKFPTGISWNDDNDNRDNIEMVEFINSNDKENSVETYSLQILRVIKEQIDKGKTLEEIAADTGVQSRVQSILTDYPNTGDTVGYFAQSNIGYITNSINFSDIINDVGYGYANSSEGGTLDTSALASNFLTNGLYKNTTTYTNEQKTSDENFATRLFGILPYYENVTTNNIEDYSNTIDEIYEKYFSTDANYENNFLAGTKCDTAESGRIFEETHIHKDNIDTSKTEYESKQKAFIKGALIYKSENANKVTTGALGDDTRNSSRFFSITCLNREVAGILASNSIKDAAGTNRPLTINYFSEMYYAYMVTIFDKTWDTSTNAGLKGGFPSIDLSDDEISNMLKQVQESVSNQIDSTKLLLKQWNVLKKVDKILNADYDVTSMTYVKGVFNQWIDSLVLSCHEKMIGSTSNGYSLVSTNGTQYNGLMSYGSIPRLNEVDITNTFMEQYQFIYTVLMLIVIGSCAFMCLANIKSVAKCVATILAMAIILTLPTTFIDGSIVISNTVSNAMYSNRFTFWSVVQHQQYWQEKLMESEAQEEDEDVLGSMASTLTTYKSYYSGNGVRLKWMSPKKINTFEQIFGSEDTEDSEGVLTMSTNVFKWLFSGYFQQESYSEDSLATYVYRPYTDLCDMANLMWESGIVGSNTEEWKDLDNYDIDLEVIDKINQGVRTVDDLEVYSKEDLEPIERTEQEVGSYIDDTYLKDIAYFIGTFCTNNSKTATGTDENMDYTEYATLWDKNAYKRNQVDDSPITVLFKDTKVYDAIFFSDIDDTATNTNIGFGELSNSNGNTWVNWENDSLAFMLYSESPFYYFYNVYKNSYTDNTPEDTTDTLYSYGYEGDNTGGTGLVGFTRVLMSNDFFKAREDSTYNNQLKDFMNLEGLFEIVIPYLRMGNEYVREWISIYGADFDFTDGVDYHDSNLEKVWALYSPWVDTLIEANQKEKTLKYMGGTVTIEDITDPYSYINDTIDDERILRYMAFGEADISAKGYGNTITTVESKINQVLQDTYIDLRYLTNYAGFKNEVLLSAAAMISTFNFNEAFSDTSLLGESLELYPQGFELKNFSYDAYLRLILLNSTGTSFLDSEGTVSLYQTVVQNSGLFTGIMLIVVDICAIYVLPAFKYVFLLGILVLSIVMCMVAYYFEGKEIVKSFIEALVKPLVNFLLVNIVHILITSMFMGEGLTDYVGSQGWSITTNDPGVTLILLAILNIIVAIIFFKLVYQMIKALAHWIKTLCGMVKDNLVETFGTIGAKIMTIGTNHLGTSMEDMGTGTGTNTGTSLGTGINGTGAEQLSTGRKKSSRGSNATDNLSDDIETQDSTSYLDDMVGMSAGEDIREDEDIQIGGMSLEDACKSAEDKEDNKDKKDKKDTENRTTKEHGSNIDMEKDLNQNRQRDDDLSKLDNEDSTVE